MKNMTVLPTERRLEYRAPSQRQHAEYSAGDRQACQHRQEGEENQETSDHWLRRFVIPWKGRRFRTASC